MTAPEIRFEGFSNEFVETKLNTIARRITRRNQDLLTTLPLTISAKFGLVDQVTYFNNRVASENLENYLVLEKGDFAYNKSSSEGFPFGTVKQLQKYDLGALSTLYIAFRTNHQSVDTSFLASYFDTNNWHRSVEIRAAEGARNHGLLNISADDFLDIPINIPEALQEQKKISGLIQNISDLINSEEEKLKNLRNLKKSMLVKMFPQHGSNVPEIRFEGFTDEWNSGRLGDFIQSYSGGTPTAGDTRYYGGSIPFIRSAEVHASKTELFLTEKGLLESSARLVEKGNILFALYGATAGEVDRSKITGAINQAILAINPDPNIESDYLVCWFSRWKEMILGKFLQGGQGNLSSKLVNDLEWQFPSCSEQKAIGDYFRTLDELIQLEEAKLNKLKNLRSSFLKKMFV